MPSILDSIKADAEKGMVDLRKEVPDLLAKLGVNTASEHAMFHAALLYLIRAVEAMGSAELKSAGL